MKVTLKELYDVDVNDVERFCVASAICARYADDVFDRMVLLDVNGYDADPWVQLLMGFKDWVDTIGFSYGVVAVTPFMQDDCYAKIIARMFMLWHCKVNEYQSAEWESSLKTSMDLPKALRPVVDWLRGSVNEFGFIIKMTGKQKKLEGSEVMTLFFSIVCHHLNATVLAAGMVGADAENELAKANRALRKSETKVKDLETQLRSARSKPPVTKEIKVRDTEYESALYDELTVAQQRITLLEDKLAVYEAVTSKEDYEVMEEIYEEEQTEIDLSQCKILIIGSHDNKDAYPFPYIECRSDTAILDKIPYVDYVLFDTRVNSHHTYFAVKQRCKASGVKMFHINNRNRDVILSEAKRLIKACK